MSNVHSQKITIMFVVTTFLISMQDAAECLTEARLHEDIFVNYNPKVRPVKHQSQTLVVTLRMYLLRINDLSEKHQLLNSNIWMDIRWTDCLLTWNESKYDGVQRILADRHKIWIPDILVQNEIGNKRGIDETTLNDAIVKANGEVTWWPGKEIKTTCKVDSTRYPFDTQGCEIDISKWYNDDTTLNITSDYDKIDLTHYEYSEEWDILETYVVKTQHFEANHNFSRLKFGLKMQRRPLFYILNVIVPLIILSVLNQLCFLLPIESGEKIGMCMSIFLTFVVFLTLISDTLPQSSIHIPIFGGYLVFQLIVSSVIICLQVIVIQTYHSHNVDNNVRSVNSVIIEHSPKTYRKSNDQFARVPIVETDCKEIIRTRNTQKATVLNRMFGFIMLVVNIVAVLLLSVIFSL